MDDWNRLAWIEELLYLAFALPSLFGQCLITVFQQMTLEGEHVNFAILSMSPFARVGPEIERWLHAWNVLVIYV